MCFCYSLTLSQWEAHIICSGSQQQFKNQTFSPRSFFFLVNLFQYTQIYFQNMSLYSQMFLMGEKEDGMGDTDHTGPPPKHCLWNISQTAKFNIYFEFLGKEITLNNFFSYLTEGSLPKNVQNKIETRMFKILCRGK